MSSACIVNNTNPAIAASFPASVSIANGARDIAPAPHHPINGDSFTLSPLAERIAPTW